MKAPVRVLIVVCTMVAALATTIAAGVVVARKGVPLPCGHTISRVELWLHALGFSISPHVSCTQAIERWRDAPTREDFNQVVSHRPDEIRWALGVLGSPSSTSHSWSPRLLAYHFNVSGGTVTLYTQQQPRDGLHINGIVRQQGIGPLGERAPTGQHQTSRGSGGPKE